MFKEKKINFTLDKRSRFKLSDLDIVNENEIGDVGEDERVIYIPILDNLSDQAPGCVHIYNKVTAIIVKNKK